jgi:hypothetical protein
MADNFAFTEGTGKTGAADDIGGVLYPRVKVQHGADGSATDVSTASPLPAQLRDSDGTDVALSGKLGSLTEAAPATDTASSGLNGRLQRIAQRITSLIALIPAALTGSGNFKVSLQESNASQAVTGTFWQATQPVSETDGANVTLGAKADAKSTATDTTAVSIMSVLKQISASVQAAASSLAGTLTVAAHAVTNAGTFAVQESGSALTALQLIDDIVYTDDTSTHSTGSSKGALLMAAATPTDASVNANDIGAVAMTTDRKLHVSVQDALPAGSNAIGKLAANSGVDIGDVDVTTVGTITPGTAATSLGKAEDAVAGSGDVGVMALAVRSDTAASTAANGDYVPLLTDSVGALHTRDTASLVDDAAFTPGTSRVLPIGLQADESATDSVDEGDAGTPRMTLDRKQIMTEQPHTAGGLTMSKTVSAASTNATSVKGSAGKVYAIQASNVNASARYLKLYNKATAPTVGSDTIVKTLIIPGNTAGAGTNIVFPTGIEFTTGIAFALTTEATDAGTTGVAASEIVVNIDYK